MKSYHPRSTVLSNMSRFGGVYAKAARERACVGRQGQRDTHVQCCYMQQAAGSMLLFCQSAMQHSRQAGRQGMGMSMAGVKVPAP